MDPQHRCVFIGHSNHYKPARHCDTLQGMSFVRVYEGLSPFILSSRLQSRMPVHCAYTIHRCYLSSVLLVRKCNNNITRISAGADEGPRLILRSSLHRHQPFKKTKKNKNSHWGGGGSPNKISPQILFVW